MTSESLKDLGPRMEARGGGFVPLGSRMAELLACV